MNPLPLVAADLRASRWGALVVALLVGCAVALSVVVSAAERSLRAGSARAADDFDLLVGGPGSATDLVLATVYLRPTDLPLVDAKRVKRLMEAKGTALVAPLAFGDSADGQPVVGTIEAFVRHLARRGMIEGRAFAREGEAVVGADVRLRLGERAVPVHGQQTVKLPGGAGHHHDEEAFSVVGRLPRSGTAWDHAILVPIETVWEAHHLVLGERDDGRIGPPWPDDAVGGASVVVIKPAGVADAYRLRQALKGDGLLALFPAETLIELYEALGSAGAVAAAIAHGAHALVLIAIGLVAMAALAARRTQIAVLRAMGAPAGFVFLVVWLEIVVLLAAGVVLGTGLAWAATAVITTWASASLGFVLPASLSFGDFSGAGLILLAGLLLAALPALFAARQPAANAP
ncbi:MAG: ABC transporter permease [Alphaproteobacteria bacterium]|nr:ABC transporter permease [Alphaproteobacteria bacterium]